MKVKLEIPDEKLVDILKQINRQKLSNLSKKAILKTLKPYDLSISNINFILTNFNELKEKYIKSFPKKLYRKETYKTKVEKKTSQLIKKGYSHEHAKSLAEKEFKTDKSIKISFVEGGKTNKR